MNLKHSLMILLAMGHIGLVALGAAGVSLTPETDERPSPATWYAHLSGTDNRFEFFAPGVGPQERVTFLLTDENGRTWTDDLRLGGNREANLSFSTIPLVLGAVDDETAWNMLRSMADAMLRRHPLAVAVQVRVDAYSIARPSDSQEPPIVDFPTMRQYRDGVRPQWRALYELSFSRSGEIASHGRSPGDTAS